MKTCLHCGQEFKPPRPDSGRQYCSIDCVIEQSSSGRMYERRRRDLHDHLSRARKVTPRSG